jgi:hypothetical protein
MVPLFSIESRQPWNDGGILSGSLAPNFSDVPLLHNDDFRSFEHFSLCAMEDEDEEASVELKDSLASIFPKFELPRNGKLELGSTRSTQTTILMPSFAVENLETWLSRVRRSKDKISLETDQHT